MNTKISNFKTKYITDIYIYDQYIETPSFGIAIVSIDETGCHPGSDED